MHMWSKLSGAKWADAWEERFAGNPNFVIEYVKGGKSVRLQVYCASKAEADAIFSQFGGSVRKMRDADWNKTPEPPKPLKVRDAFLVTAETDAKKLAALRKEHGKREIIVIPPEMAFGTGDHATTSTCLRFLVDISRERIGTEWTVADLGTGTGLLAIAAASNTSHACVAKIPETTRSQRLPIDFAMTGQASIRMVENRFASTTS